MGGDSVGQGQQRKKSSRDRRLHAGFPSDSMAPNLSWIVSMQQPGGEKGKWGAPSNSPDFKVSVISTVPSPRSSSSFFSSENTDIVSVLLLFDGSFAIGKR